MHAIPPEPCFRREGVCRLLQVFDREHRLIRSPAACRPLDLVALLPAQPLLAPLLSLLVLRLLHVSPYGLPARVCTHQLEFLLRQPVDRIIDVDRVERGLAVLLCPASGHSYQAVLSSETFRRPFCQPVCPLRRGCFACHGLCRICRFHRTILKRDVPERANQPGGSYHLQPPLECIPFLPVPLCDLGPALIWTLECMMLQLPPRLTCSPVAGRWGPLELPEPHRGQSPRS